MWVAFATIKKIHKFVKKVGTHDRVSDLHQ